MQNTAQIQQQIDLLNNAIRSGEQSITFNGRTVTYRSVTELLKARNDAVASLVQARGSNNARTHHFAFKTLRGD